MEEDLLQTQMKIQQAPVPRNVVFNPGSLLEPVLWFVMLFFSFIFYTLRGEFIRAAASAFGPETMAQVVSTRSWTTTSKGRTYEHYAATVAFPLPEKTYVSEAPVSMELYARLGYGDMMTVNYIPGFKEPYIDSGGGIIITLVLPAILLFILAWVARLQFDLLKRGMPVIGDIIGVRRGNKGAIFWDICYKCRGEEITKEFGGESNNPEKVVLLVDVEKPKRAVIYNKKFIWKLADNIY